MNPFYLGENTYFWIGEANILKEDYFKVSKSDNLYVKEITNDFNLKGIILIGNLNVIVDSVIYSSSKGACGDTYQFLGKSLVILGITLEELESSLKIIVAQDERKKNIDDKASVFISNLQKKIHCKSLSVEFEKDEEVKYLIFGKNDFFLIGNNSKFVLIHKKQISIRSGERKLVEISPEVGIRISDKKKSFSIKGPRDASDFSILGEMGVNIASTILENLIWE
ncbi:MAG: hypothetical protein ACXACP_10650 [Candidatus Hodarchaeales archaeon]|jgi:hypothetical protein